MGGGIARTRDCQDSRGRQTRRVYILCHAAVLLVLAAAWAEAPGTEIPGSVTARREGAVRVSFEPRADVVPAVGDAAAFKTLIQGIEVDAGRGEVVEVEPASAWVRVSSVRPALGNQVLIRATGRPAPKEKREPARATPPAPVPPPALGLVRHDLNGIGRVWLPRPAPRRREAGCLLDSGRGRGGPRGRQAPGRGPGVHPHQGRPGAQLAQPPLLCGGSAAFRR